MNILHISQTPLVAAPEKISTALNEYTPYESKCLILQDYAKVKSTKFIDKAILFDRNNLEYYKELINATDIIHIHNDINQSFINFILLHHNNQNTRFIYQTHSCPREGPLYFDRSKAMPFSFDAKLAVAQYQPRFHPDFFMVPNIILQEPSLKINSSERIKIIFSPAQYNSSGRWGTKYSLELNDALQYFSNSNDIEILNISGVHPNELYHIRTNTDITIDEISTGGFHQVSLEGLCAGNVVINGADYISREIMRSISAEKKYAPFEIGRNKTIKTVLKGLIENRDKLNQKKEKSYHYYFENLKPEYLIQKYVYIYEKIRI